MNRRHPSESPYLGGQFERLFDNLLNRNMLFSPGTARRASFPALNVWEDHDHLFVEAEVPGVKMEDIDITIVGDELSISGERKPPAEEEATLHRQERSSGKFQRGLKLPVEINAEAIEATLKAGVLKLRLPKAPQAKPRKIEVKTG